ncbi:hypothetical protein [Clostridium chauvoei]|uniref:Uncharacterized protein n=2 Tax=Clostridium chauvoei TaxID=46867 RepID=S6FJB5_9CLOT|nr:hypothetical protein [Clostridium chauvoei]MBX7281340.1 hypothetical protein [Clostridium chauvoei]MBX7283822.1 hypothetical protein [Clostridium chauvoei]MBX7286429.1 hypothetical protein [Clostridium chauvoei]MBX7288884.1 hypothetical protein [Clostridium chauvoei]MBX7291424.1 hypothetical protein [Clostridium chauvoei]
MSNNKKNRTNGTIPSVGKEIADPVNSTNIATSFYKYPAKDQITRKSKTNQLY